ncbi:class I tRNA ligase family protein [Streptomyces sp. LX-29]|uniref:methionine--tRNA ligase n=1 Tax=Streptomyces sp. LX-29 TaxID=2900152 RepID=UPI00240DA816|nr:class I tRNA ligase family protein [Streptomyces sp. LX-29]WFB06731.1 class I tRNA ligase family protein [Streptomyces sp. LX-29]
MTYVVTSAPPNPNGDLHLGHLSGPFLGADVLRRHLAQLGHEVRHVGYSDEHSCYVPRRAHELGRGARETAYAFGQKMQSTLALADMSHDYFTRPLREPLHTKIVQRFFLDLWNKGALEVQELPVFRCEPCDRYLYEAEVRGACQFCAAPSDGVYCEECGRPQDPAGLAEAHCTRCGATPVLSSLRRIVFPLDRYREQLGEYYARAGEGESWRPRLRAYLDDMISRPLPDTPVSREADYGIPVPLPEWEGHILDTWFSGIWGYVAATAGLAEAEGDPERWERWWSDPDTEIVHFLGFDCSFSHAILWPSLLMAHGELTLPSQIIINEFYRLEGDKFSTSRGHAIWGGEFLRQVSADALRFHLCLTGPEREQTNFYAREFDETVDTLLVQNLQQWAGDIVALACEDFEKEVPDVGLLTGELAVMARKLPQEVAEALSPQAFSPQRATKLIAAAIDRLAKDLPMLRAWRTSGGVEYRMRLVTHLELLARVAAVSAPIMPGWSAYVLGRLGVAPVDPFTGTPAWPGVEPLLAAGHRLTGPLSPFFQGVHA